MRSMRRLAWPGVWLVPIIAQASLRIRWDCYLPDSGFDCGVIESSLASSVPFVEMVGGDLPVDVAVTLRSLPAEDGVWVLFDFVGKDVEGHRTEVHTNDRIPSSVAQPTAIVRIMTKLERGLDDFMDQREVAQVKNGKLTLELVDPLELPYSGRAQQEGLRWYLTPQVGSYFSQVEGVGINASGNASIAFNYSGDRVRIQSSLGSTYNRESQPVPSTGETASVSFFGASVSEVASYSFDSQGQWSLAILLAGEKNPQANYALRGNASIGIEYDLFPLQTVNQRNLGFRCAVGPEYQRYDAINVEGLSQQTLGRQQCDVFITWHFAPLDLGGSLAETSLSKGFEYRTFSAGGSMSFRATDNWIVSPWVNVQQVNRAINEALPADSPPATPKEEIEASMRAAIQRGYTSPFGVQAGLSIRYLFGNGTLSSEDRRWKGASPLR